MSELKQKCELNDCHRGASTRCYCCNKSICARHFTEHIDVVRAQVDPLANEINTMVEQIRDLTIEHLIEAPAEKLHRWKDDMHLLVDQIFAVKNKEIEEIVEQNQVKFSDYKKRQLEVVMKIQEEVKQLAEEDDATFHQIESLKMQLSGIEEDLRTFQTHFLSIDIQTVGQNCVNVSSSLNHSPTVINTATPLTWQFSMLASASGFNSPDIVTSTDQSSGLDGDDLELSSASSSNVISFGSILFGPASTTATINTLPFSSTPCTFENHPFSGRDDSTNRRPAIKVKQRAKHW